MIITEEYAKELLRQRLKDCRDTAHQLAEVAHNPFDRGAALMLERKCVNQLDFWAWPLKPDGKRGD